MSGFTTDPDSWPDPPVILITGGNSGIGLGIAERLIKQLSTPNPPDASCFANSSARSDFCTPNGCHLVIASRNERKGREALARLQTFAQRTCDRVSGASSFDYGRKKNELSAREYTMKWIQHLHLDFIKLDLSSVDATFDAVSSIRGKYSYISHLILNAGVAPVIGLDWHAIVTGLFTNFFATLTSGSCTIEEKGKMTDDGLGWTWQCNVFGHYLFARRLLPLLYASPFNEPRLIWTSSMEATAPTYYSSQDPMALETEHSYSSTKYQAMLLAWHFNTLISQHPSPGKSQAQPKSFVVEPGVVATDMMKETLGVCLDFLQVMVFYVARFFGASSQTVRPYAAGMAFVFISLVPFAALEPFVAKAVPTKSTGSPLSEEQLRFSAKVSKLGTAYCEPHIVQSDVVKAGKRAGDTLSMVHTSEVSQRCDSLYRGFLAVRGEAEDS